MRDISSELHWIMLEHHCSPMQALYILSTEVVQNGVCSIQSESNEKTCGGLRNKSNLQNNESTVGRCIS